MALEHLENVCDETSVFYNKNEIFHFSSQKDAYEFLAEFVSGAESWAESGANFYMVRRMLDFFNLKLKNL